MKVFNHLRNPGSVTIKLYMSTYNKSDSKSWEYVIITFRLKMCRLDYDLH